MREAGLFAYAVEAETYAAASEVHDLLVKTHPADKAKIEATKRLVLDHFDVDGLLARVERFEGRAGPSTETSLPTRTARVGLGDRLAGLARALRWRT
jgi:hypothetical protein